MPAARVDPGFVAALAAAADDQRVAVGVSEPDARTAFERASGWFTLRAFKPADQPGPIAGELLPAGRNGLCFTRAAWEKAGGYPPELPWGEDKVFTRATAPCGSRARRRPRAPSCAGARAAHSGRSTVSTATTAAATRSRGSTARTSSSPSASTERRLVLAVLFALGSRTAGAFLVAGAAGYLALFVLSARRSLGADAALAWVPPLRLVVDVAKMQGFLEGVLLRRPTPADLTTGTRGVKVTALSADLPQREPTGRQGGWSAGPHACTPQYVRRSRLYRPRWPSRAVPRPRRPPRSASWRT